MVLPQVPALATISRPQWQDTVVETYINGLENEFDGLYNRSGRAYPDLAAQGFRYLVFVNGTAVSLDGTSASAPTIASVFSLVNDALIAKGKPTLGWLNPWLYSKGYVAFNDVVEGSAIGCSGPGFSAGPGWDVPRDSAHLTLRRFEKSWRSEACMDRSRLILLR